MNFGFIHFLIISFWLFYLVIFKKTPHSVEDLFSLIDVAKIIYFKITIYKIQAYSCILFILLT